MDCGCTSSKYLTDVSAACTTWMNQQQASHRCSSSMYHMDAPAASISQMYQHRVPHRRTSSKHLTDVAAACTTRMHQQQVSHRCSSSVQQLTASASLDQPQLSPGAPPPILKQPSTSYGGSLQAIALTPGLQLGPPAPLTWTMARKGTAFSLQLKQAAHLTLMVAMASMPPAAPRQWPIMDLVAFIFIPLVLGNTCLMARTSAMSPTCVLQVSYV